MVLRRCMTNTTMQYLWCWAWSTNLIINREVWSDELLFDNLNAGAAGFSCWFAGFFCVYGTASLGASVYEHSFEPFF